MTDNQKDIDAAVTALVRLKGMFGAMTYLINPGGKAIDNISEDFESWFSDIHDKLDEVIDLL